MNKELTKNCVQCGTEFNYVPNKLNEQKYCSKVCRNKSNNIRRIQLIRDEYENVTPITDNFNYNKLKPLEVLDWKQKLKQGLMDRDNINNMENNKDYPKENNKDYYTLYLEEKHARHIDQIETYYTHLLNRQDKVIQKLKEDDEIDEEVPESNNLLKNVIGGLSEIGKQIEKYRDENGKVVKM